MVVNRSLKLFLFVCIKSTCIKAINVNLLIEAYTYLPLFIKP